MIGDGEDIRRVDCNGTSGWRGRYGRREIPTYNQAICFGGFPSIKISFSNRMGKRGQPNVFSRLGGLQQIGPLTPEARNPNYVLENAGAQGRRIVAENVVSSVCEGSEAVVTGRRQRGHRRRRHRKDGSSAESQTENCGGAHGGFVWGKRRQAQNLVVVPVGAKGVDGFCDPSAASETENVGGGHGGFNWGIRRQVLTLDKENGIAREGFDCAGDGQSGVNDCVAVPLEALLDHVQVSWRGCPTALLVCKNLRRRESSLLLRMRMMVCS